MTATFEAVQGRYGQDWTLGILAEHTGVAPIEIHITASGKTYATAVGGGKAVPVLCGELVEIRTEDGSMTGRCGGFVYENGFACPGHSEGYTDETCEHGLSAWLCEGPNHYPSDF